MWRVFPVSGLAPFCLRRSRSLRHCGGGAAEAQGRPHLRRPAAQRRAAARGAAIRLRARHHQGVEEAPHPALLRIHQRETARAQSRRRAALQIWVDGGHPLANHTYTHLDLTKNSAEDFQREILRNEPVLELLMPEVQKTWAASTTGAGSVIPYLHEGDTLEKRRAVRAFLVDQRLPHRADHARLRGLLLEQRVRALLDAQGRSVHPVAEARVTAPPRASSRAFRSRTHAPYSAATSTT